MHMTILRGGHDGRKPTTRRGITMSVHLPNPLNASCPPRTPSTPTC